MWTEVEAIAAMRAGDPRGLDTILCLHQVDAVRIAFAITGQLAAAEDAASEAFIKAYDHIQQFDTTRSFKPWLLRIVVNEAKKATRGFNRLVTGPGAQEVVDAQLESVDLGPEAAAVRTELRYLIMMVMAELSAMDRAALALRYYKDWDERAVADALGCSLGAAKIRLTRVRQRFRKHLLQGSPALLAYLEPYAARAKSRGDWRTAERGPA